MSKFIFKIDGMCCAEETRALKRTLKSFVAKEQDFVFDIINGKMTINCKSDDITEEKIIQRVAKKTSMKAKSWQEYLEQKEKTKAFWLRYSRIFAVILSGACLFLGLFLHALQHGWMDAIASGGGTAEHTFPIIAIMFYLISILSGGWFIFPKALKAIKRLRPDMNLLMLIAVIGAVAISQWFEGAAVTFLFSLALLMESWSVGRARKAISSLVEHAPSIAHYLAEDKSVIDKPIAEIPVGAILIVKPGEKIPMDGVLIEGSSTANQAPITGESMPVPKEVGDELFAGTINGDGAISLKVTKVADDSVLSRIIRMVEDAQSRRAQSEKWVEKFARIYTPLMMLFALLVVIVPPLLFGAQWYAWIYEGLVILVIACPCALVISTPVSIVAGLNTAARAGVLIKGGIYLEAPAHIEVMAIDKTGTLTLGEPEVQNVIPLSQHTEAELLQRAAALEAHSNHPLARAILTSAKANNIDYQPATDYQIIKGKGAEGNINGKSFWIGSHRFLHEKVGKDEPTELHQKALELEAMGHSVIVIGNDDHICGIISVADAIRPETKEAIVALKKANVKKVVMLTGDNQGTANSIAQSIGLDDFHAELLPEDKVRQIEKFIKGGQYIAMVGDGVNDAPAMAVANLGIAMGAMGADAAIETADIALMTDNLNKLPWLVQHSRRTLKIIKQNITFALAIKLVFIVLALAGIATLWMAIAADMGASFIVISNGLRLLKQH